MQGDLFAGPDPVFIGRQVPDLGLRYYQQEAREAVQKAHRSARGALVCLPTGTGKSRLAGSIAWDHAVTGSKVLILCPTITLTQQMYEDIRKLGLSVGIEQADNRVARPLPAVTIACVHSMRGARLASFGRDEFGLVVSDEAHRSISPLYAGVFAHFESARLLGLTATPDRSDGVSLANVFTELAYEMSMLRAISEGWLTPLRFKTAITNFDAKALRTVAGEVDPGSVAKEIVRSGLLHEAANTLAELAEGERTVAFLPTVASSKAFVAELIARNISAAHIDGTTPTTVRDETFKLFVDGHLRVLSNVGCLVEGWDCPAASVIALLNPTKSRSRVCQMVGRGTRLLPGKTSTLVIDFCPGRLKKGRLASPADALAGKMLDDEVYAQLPESGDLAESIEKAERTAADIEEQKRRAEEAARARAERTAALAQHATRRDFDYSTQEHDSAAILGGYVEDAPVPARARSVQPPLDDERRRKIGMCSEKQAAVLKRFGLNSHMKRHLAREALDAISANGWKLPAAIKADPRFYLKSVNLPGKPANDNAASLDISTTGDA